MTYRFLCMISMAVAMTAVNAQFTDYDISFEAVEIDGWSGVQSFAFGHAGSDVLIIGGRRDGLHLRQPFAGFDIPGHNTFIMVLNLDTRESWSWDITGLPADVEDQLSSTNLNFIQVEDKLILIGGYGYSRLKTDHVTFEGLIVVDIPALTAGVKNNSVDPGMFKYTSDPGFAVTGGHLLKLYDTYYLAGGQRFDGRYNPMNHATFTQAYTEEVRRFRLDPETLEYSWLAPFQDGELLHRRDLNIQPVIGHDGEEAFILYSGVFQKTADLPFLNAVYVDSNGVSEVPGLIQLFNHYHCAALPVFDETHREMTTIFFGGMAQYYMDGGKLIKDDNVPFVRTIARIVRNEDGEYYEERLDLEMPGLLGSSAEFVINPQLPQYPNEVLNWSDIDSDSVFLGYIIGGISSTARNIFFVNDGSQSITNPTILRVTATERVYTSTREDKEEDLFVHAFPNPSDGRLTVNFSMKKKGRVHIDLFDQEGQLIRELFEEELSAGWHSYDLIIPDLVNSGHYLLIVRSGESTGRCSVIIN